MGQIDITALFGDPDFVEGIAIIHRKPFIDTYGENKLIETSVATVGVVQPASGKTIARLPDAMKVLSLYSFWVKGEIIADGKCEYPDLIVFQGQRYAVQMIMDWMNWPSGGGWSEGLCIRQAITL